MPSVCMYFQVHQPYRVKRFGVFDIGSGADYFDDEKNREICKKVADKCYLPANKTIMKLIKKHKGKFRCSYSISGITLEQFGKYAPEVLTSFQDLAATGCVEFLAETYYHSLSSLYSEQEFFYQVKKQIKTIEKYFGQTPTVFRNTELVYHDYLADLIKKFHFKAILAEGWDPVLGWRSPNYLYRTVKGTKLMLKNYKLSDDIAFRFSNKDWEEWPLTAEKFSNWVNAINGNGEVINLFMDYETFGEHQWKETGIFKFLEKMPEEIMKNPDIDFVTVSEEAQRYRPYDTLSMPNVVSWADTERDISAWLGNKMQTSGIEKLYELGERIKKAGSRDLLNIWRKLQTSDHFYYMCTKYWADGDVHKYFSPYDRPHDGYSAFNNILVDLIHRLEGVEEVKEQNIVS